jgi:hypothetical protein
LKGKPQLWQPLVEGQVSSLRLAAAAAGPAAASSIAAASSRIAAARAILV